MFFGMFPGGRQAHYPWRITLWATTAIMFAPMTALAQSSETGNVVEKSGRSQGVRSFNIPSQSLGTALSLFSAQSGLQVTRAGDLSEKQVANSVVGAFTADQGLARLLQGTGIQYRMGANRSVVISPSSSSEGKAAVDDGSYLLPTIVVTGQNGLSTGEDPYKTAASTVHISGEKIDRFRGTSVGDFLSGTPGVINGDNRASGAIDINIRGMQGQGRVPVVVDGSTQETTVDRGYSGVQGRTYLDPDLIADMTIEKGPSGAADAVGATGGVARIRTLQADDILKEGKSFGVRVKGSVIGNNISSSAAVTPGGSEVERTPNLDRPGIFGMNGGSGSIAVAKRFEDIDLDLVGAYAKRQTGNYFAGTKGSGPSGINQFERGEEVLNTELMSQSTLLRGVYRFGDGHSIDLGYTRYRAEKGEASSAQAIRSAGPLQAPASDIKADTYTARYHWNPDDSDLIDLKADLYRTHVFQQLEIPIRVRLPGGSVQNLDNFYANDADRTGINLSNTSRFDGTRFGDLAVTYGASYLYETATPPSDFDARFAASGYPAYTEARDGWRKEASAFTTAELKPYDWLKLDATLRYTNTETQDRNAGGLSRNRGYYAHQQSSGVAPIFAVTVEPVDGFQIYGRYAEAIRAASLFEATNGFSLNTDPSGALKPEHAHNKEIGINYKTDISQFGGGTFGWKAAYFDNRINDYINRGYDANPTSCGTGCVNSLGSVAVNMQKAIFRGFELSANYDSGRYFAEASATRYTHIEICDQAGLCGNGSNLGYIGNQIPPEFSASATVGARFYDEKLTLGARLTHVGKRADGTLTSAGSSYTIKWDPYTVADVFGSYKINDDYKLEFAVDNVFDRYYMDALTLGTMPSPGRTFRASITAKF